MDSDGIEYGYRPSALRAGWCADCHAGTGPQARPPLPLSHPMLRKALFVLSGNGAASAFTLARNLLLARLLPLADYGIAATFAVTIAVVEMASTLGLQQQIVQAKEGDEPRFQAVLQGFQLMRGALSALALLLLAGPLAEFLGIPEVTWAYQLLALMPVLNALVHFDVYRMQRRTDYRPVLLTVTLPALVSLVAIWPLVLLAGDWRAMLWAILVQGAVAMLVSHRIAERHYALAFDRAVITRSLRFGWPILMDAVLMFFVFHGEKLIVGRELGMAALGLFAMGITLTLTPTQVASRSAFNLFLPRLSSPRDTDKGEARFQRTARAACEANFIFGTALATGVLILGGPFVLWVLGQKYADLIPLLTLLGILQGLRVFKEGPSVVALSQGQTENALAANLIRVALLPVAWVVAARTGSMEAIVWLAIIGEMAGITVALALMRWRTRVALGPLWLPLAASVAVLAGAMAAREAGLSASPWALAGVVALFMLSLLTMRALRGFLGNAI